MLGAGLVGAAVILVLLRWRRSELHIVHAVPLWAFVAGGVVVLVALLYRRGESRWGAFTGTRHLATYPPLWVGSLFGTGVVLLTLGFFDQIRQDVGLRGESPPLVLGGILRVVAVALLAAASGVVLLVRRQGPIHDLPPVSPPLSQSFGSFEKLTEWLLDDSVPTRAGADMFGHARVAQRIAGRLLEPRPPAQAVVGKLGAGKTTLRSLVIDALATIGAQRQVQVVPIELWPYETSRAAVEGVIRALVKSLAMEVNVIGLQGVAAAYAEAMSAAGGWWAALVRVQGVPAKPLDVLNAINDVATAIGIRYVVWIEDLERFAGEGPSETVEEKLNPIRALLCGLDQLSSITVVTATTTLRMRFDIEKIARYVEPVPELPAPLVAKTLNIFRRGCIETTDVIDPAAPAARGELNSLGSASDFTTRLLLVERGFYTTATALCAMCVTPRAMKQALRSCLDVWGRLSGEIDFDDVLILCVLRETQPAAFALIQDSLHHLRGGTRGNQEDRSKAQEAWEKSLQSLGMDASSLAAVKCVIEFVFGEQHVNQKPQGVFHRYPTDYWERFAAIPRLEDAERDQRVLRTILAEDDETLLDLLQSESRESSAVEHFEELLSPERVVRLFVPLVERRSREDVSSWSSLEPPGLIPLWHMWNRCWGRNELSSATVLDQVKRALDIAVPRNLGLATEIEQYFVVSSEKVPQLLGGQERTEAKKYLRDLLVATYRDRATALVERLKGAPTPTLLWLCWGLDRAQSGDTSGVPFAEWETFAPTVVEACRREPRVMLPQVAWLLVKQHGVISRGPRLQYEFAPDVAARLFGSIEAVGELFHRAGPAAWSDSPEEEAVRASLQERPGAAQTGPG